VKVVKVKFRKDKWKGAPIFILLLFFFRNDLHILHKWCKPLPNNNIKPVFDLHIAFTAPSQTFTLLPIFLYLNLDVVWGGEVVQHWTLQANWVSAGAPCKEIRKTINEFGADYNWYSICTDPMDFRR